MLDIPIRTIRYYEKISLVHPYLIDRDSGYRYYSMEEIFHLDLIRCLGRELGMPLKKIREYIEREQEPATLKQYLNEQAEELEEQIDMLLSRKNFLMAKLKAVTMREFMRPAVPRIVMREARKIFVKYAKLQDVEDALLTIRKLVKESGNRYDTSTFLLRTFDPNNLHAKDLGQVLIGLDCALGTPNSEMILPAGKYAEVVYENRLDKRAEALKLFMEFLKRSGFTPEGHLIFSGTLLDTVSVKSDAYCLKVEIRLTSDPGAETKNPLHSE
jgi:DNA-binding transcriptional MerR regulator